MSKPARGICLLLGALVTVTALTACQPRARVRPIEAGPASTGPGSTQWVRQQLEGTWTLESLQVAGADGQLRPVQATATLTYDAYGNLEMKGRIADAAMASAAGSVLDFKGRAVIDTQKQELHLLDVDQTEGDLAKMSPELAASRARAYEFSGSTMTLRTKNAKGEVRAVVVWRK